MSIKTVSSSNIAPRDIPAPVFPTVSNTVEPAAWVRPSDWLTLPTVTSTDQKFAGLLAITNDNTNYIAFSATTSAGTYTVDWGDGTSNTYTSGTVASKVFDYASISPSTYSTQGYRQTIITVTATTGNLTGIGLQIKYTNVPALGAYTAKWLDIIIGSPFMISTSCGAGSLTVGMGWLQQYQLMSTASTFSGLTFNSCAGLQSVPTLNFSNITANTYNGIGFFQSCAALKIAPSIDLTKFNNLSQFFYNCQSLQVVPNYTTSVNNTTCSNMFYGCRSLRSIGGLDVSKVTTASNMFANCDSLQTIPRLNFTTLLTDCSFMFQGSPSITAVPLFNTTNVTTISSMFNGCSSLQSLPLYNFANVTTAVTPFASCVSLKSVPGFNFSKVTDTSNWFSACTALTTTGPFIFTNLLTNVTNMFLSCYNLKNVSLFNTAGVTNFSGMFQNCYNLQSVPQFNTIAGINMTSMLQTCYNLRTIPTFNTSNANNFTQMFYQCRNLQDVPLIDTGKALTTTSMFNQCYSLKTIPAFNLGNATDTSGMFTSAYSFTTIPSTLTIPKATTTSSMFYQCYSLTDIPTTFANSMVNAFSLQNMFQFCTSLRTIPDLPCTTITGFTSTVNGCSSLSSTGTGNFYALSGFNTSFTNCNTLANINFTNMRGGVDLTGTILGKTAMENVFANLMTGPTFGVQTITITSTPAASAAVSLAGTWGNASNIVTMTNTTNLIVGMTCTGANMSGNVSITTYANNKISANNLATANTMIRVYANTGGLIANTPYYVSNASGTSPTYYDVSNVAGGTPLTLTAAGPANGQFDVRIASINTNANIVLTAWPNGNATTTAFSSRNLNTNLATFKGATITG